MTTKELTGNDVISAILMAHSTKSPGHKAKATRYLNKYVEQRSAIGFRPVMVEAGIKARVAFLRKLRH